MQSSQCFGTRFFILILKYRIKVNGAPGIPWASQVVLVIKNPPANAADVRNQVQSLGWEDPLEEEMAAHSGILAWRIPWSKEPGDLQSMGPQRVGHN